MIISAVQWGDSVIHVHTSILFQILFHMDYHRILGRVACAVQQVTTKNLAGVYIGIMLICRELRSILS